MLRKKTIKNQAIINVLVGIGGGLFGFLLIGIFNDFTLTKLFCSIIGGLILSMFI